MATLGVTLYNQDLYMKCNISLVLSDMYCILITLLCCGSALLIVIKSSLKIMHTRTLKYFLTTVAECMQHRESASQGFSAVIYDPAVALHGAAGLCYPCCLISVYLKPTLTLGSYY